MRYGQNSKGGNAGVGSRGGKSLSKPYGTPTRDYRESL